MPFPKTGREDTIQTSFEGGPPVIEQVTVGELRGVIPIESSKVASRLTDQDKQDILALNPFVTGQPLDSQRFRPAQLLDVRGPARPGGAIPGTIYMMSYDESHDTTLGDKTEFEAKVYIKSKIPFLLSDSSVQGGDVYSYEYESTTTATTGKTQTASVTLSSTNPCVHFGVQVLYDNAFRTFAFQSAGPTTDGLPPSFNCCGASHPLCTVGASLSPSCTANQCQQTICAQDQFCCLTKWDFLCVIEATDICEVSDRMCSLIDFP